MVVGDADQNIYGWRFAFAKNMHLFAQELPGVKILKLDQNYRSTMHILHCSNAIIASSSQRLADTKMWSALGDGEPRRG